MRSEAHALLAGCTAQAPSHQAGARAMRADLKPSVWSISGGEAEARAEASAGRTGEKNPSCDGHYVPGPSDGGAMDLESHGVFPCAVRQGFDERTILKCARCLVGCVGRWSTALRSCNPRGRMGSPCGRRRASANSPGLQRYVWAAADVQKPQPRNRDGERWLYFSAAPRRISEVFLFHRAGPRCLSPDPVGGGGGGPRTRLDIGTSKARLPWTRTSTVRRAPRSLFVVKR